jgi:ABC-2 type transport system permease protein
VYAQTLFQSAALGLISLIEDRENDFSQEIFVSPVSRYSIVFGKIVGESLVALPQGLAIIPLGWLLAGPFSAAQLLALLWVAIVVCLFGGAFGLLVLSSLRSQRAANQVFPFIMLPQFFLAGVFNPLENLPWYLEILSRLAPMRYAVDLTRGVFYAGLPAHDAAVVDPLPLDAAVIAGSFLIFIVVGTAMFVRAERNR